MNQPDPALASQKLLAARGVKLRLAALSAVILCAGALAAPRARQTPLSVPQERAAPLIEEQVQPPAAPPPFRGVHEVGLKVRPHTAIVAPAGRALPETVSDFAGKPGAWNAHGSGVFVSATHVLTHADALEARATADVIGANGTRSDGSVAAFDPGSGLVLLQTQPMTVPPAPIATQPVIAGTLAVAVGSGEGREQVVPVFVTSAAAGWYTLSGEDAARPGMPVFNMEGELIAVVGDEPGRAFVVTAAVDQLMSRAAAGERLGAIGIAFQNLEAPLTRVFGEQGVLISAVIEGGPASEAGVLPGDVLLAVNDMETASAEAAARQLSAGMGTPARLQIARDGRSRTVNVTPATAYEVAAIARRASEPLLPEARQLLSPAQLEAAGVPATARIVSLDGRAVSSRAQAQRALRTAARPAALLLRAGGRQFFVVIEQAR
jgi:S1-C subfamily serine protease